MENLDSLKIASNLIKSQREKRGITIEEISIELKLEKKIIEDIENRNFGNFKSYLFLKGYLINYANLLDVKISLPEVKKQKKSQTKKNITDKSKNKNKDKNKYKNSIQIKLIFSFLILTSVFFIIFNNKNINQNNVDLKNKLIDKPISKNEKAIEISKDNTLSNEQQIKVEEIFINKTKSQPELPNNDTVTPSLIDKQISENNKSIKNSFKKTLLIEYTGDSWTEIIDSKGEIVFFDLVKSGDKIDLNIASPIEILLGNATVVNIKYNNNIINIPYVNPENNVSKIIIEE
jgi:cytoskeleton protein RodZ